jgi:hypothetical protein
MKYLKLFESFDDDIKSICDELNITNWTVNSDGTIDVDGDVWLVSKELKKLPLKFGKVSGNFYCYDNQLTNLEGGPNRVSGEFDCSTNQLTSLLGGPKVVGGNFDCYNNNLTSLLGGPIEVGGNFWCGVNQLTTLIGGPKEVGRDFNCEKNNLITLEGAPNHVGGNFDCDGNKLISLEGAPRDLGGNFWCEGNPIYKVYCLFPNYKSLMDSMDYNYLRGNKIDRKRLEEALDEIGQQIPDNIIGWGFEYIDNKGFNKKVKTKYPSEKLMPLSEGDNNLLTEDISGSMNAAIVYHRTAGMGNIIGIIKDGYIPTSNNMGIYGKGFYACYKKESLDNIPYGKRLGNYTLKCLVNNLRGNFLIFDIKEAKKIYGNNYNLYEQISGLDKKAIEYLKEVNISFKNGWVDHNSILFFTKEFNNLLGNQIKGIIYRIGGDDTDVLICYNSKKEEGFLHILGYNSDFSNKFNKIRYNKNNIELEYSEWVSNLIKNPKLIKYVPTTIDKYYQLCKIAISKNGDVLQYIPKDKLTKELCLLAVSNNIFSIEYIPSNIDGYIDICKLAVSGFVKYFHITNPLEYIKIDDKLKKQLEPYISDFNYFSNHKISYQPNEDTSN